MADQTTDEPGTETAAAILAAMRAAPPLVQCITNYVAMNFAANVLLAAGAAPAMVHAAEEAGEFAGLAGALTVNLGTISPPWVAGMTAAIEGARSHGRPWVLDPVAVGATSYRRWVGAELAAHHPTAIRGNASEILALAGAESRGRGVDAGDSVDQAEAAARDLARKLGAVVAVTGERDFVTDGQRAARITGGHALMPRITAMGCALTCLTGATLAVRPDRPMEAVVAALALYAEAGAAAGAAAAGPGSFQPAFLDALARAGAAGLSGRARIAWD